MHCHPKIKRSPNNNEVFRKSRILWGSQPSFRVPEMGFSESSRHLDQDTNETRFILSVNCGVKASLLLPCTPHEPKSCKTFWVRFHSFGLSGGNPPN